jgi:hypothetical protein
MKVFFIKYWKVILTGFVLTALVFVFIVPSVLHRIIENRIRGTLARAEKKIGRKIVLENLDFPGVTTITIDRIGIASDSTITARLEPAGFASDPNVLEVKNINIRWYLGGIFTGQFLQTVTADSLALHFIKLSGDVDNFKNLLKVFRSDSAVTAENQPPSEKNKIALFINTYLEKRLPSIELKHLNVTYQDYSEVRLSKPKRHQKPSEFRLDDFKITLRESLLRDAQFEAHGTVVQNSSSNRADINGTVDHSKRQILLNALFDSHFKIPFIDSLIGGRAAIRGFDAQIFSLEDDRERSDLLAALNVNSLEIESEIIAESKLRDLDLGFYLDLNFGPDDMIIRPDTRIYLNRITGYIGGKIANMRGLPQFDMNFKLPMIAMNDFFASIPIPLMSRIDGIKVRGSFEFDATLQLDLDQLDSIKYKPHLTLSEDFRVLSLGDSIEVKMLRDSFDYTFRTENDSDSTFVVGRINPYYEPLDSLPPIFVNSVLFCEDNSFFKNDGFNVLQIGRSLRDNIRAKHFARGASTISMQFIKNIYLSREKTIARKFQELILTWLFNHEKLLDEKRDKEKHKKRLLEIYLNIIEWGPDVRGVGRAAEFYFKKKPKDLTVGESVFLATIIPNPKKYDRYFENGVPKNKHANFMNLIVKMLHEKDIIDSLTMAQNLPCTFSISGEARRLISGYKGSDSSDTEAYYKELDFN